MFFGDAPDPRFDKFMPLVAYAVERQLGPKAKDYWVQATALELAALGGDAANANKYALVAVTAKPQKWMKDTTATNLQKIYDKASAGGNANLQWLQDIISKRLS